MQHKIIWDNGHYIYIHVKQDSGEVFYVGKGKNNRAYHKGGRSKWWQYTIAKYGYDIFILENNLSEPEAFRLEKEYIQRIGRRDLGLGPLVNLTDGGEGASGTIVSKETRKKVSNNNCRYWDGKTIPIDMKKRISSTLYGRYRGGDSPNSKMLLDISTGIYYDSLIEACEALNLIYKNTSYSLNKAKKNKTNLKYV